MKLDLKELMKELSLPLGLVALFAAILGLFGLDLDMILKIVEGLTGTFTFVALLINVLKWIGVVKDGTSGRWSAALNLAVLIVVTILFKLYPTFDYNSLDEQLAEFARVAGIVFAYVIQLVGSKQIHMAITRGLWLPAFSFSMLNRMAGGYTSAYATKKIRAE